MGNQNLEKGQSAQRVRERERVERETVILWSPICKSFRGVALRCVGLGLFGSECSAEPNLLCLHVPRMHSNASGPTSGNGFCFTDENQGD
jgi:hypothetical protein